MKNIFCIFIDSSLLQWTTDVFMENILQKFGMIKTLKFEEEKNNGKSKGILNCEFDDKFQAMKAKETLNGMNIHDNVIQVEYISKIPTSRYSVNTQQQNRRQDYNSGDTNDMDDHEFSGSSSHSSMMNNVNNQQQQQQQDHYSSRDYDDRQGTSKGYYTSGGGIQSSSSGSRGSSSSERSSYRGSDSRGGGGSDYYRSSSSSSSYPDKKRDRKNYETHTSDGGRRDRYDSHGSRSQKSPRRYGKSSYY